MALCVCSLSVALFLALAVDSYGLWLQDRESERAVLAGVSVEASEPPVASAPTPDPLGQALRIARTGDFERALEASEDLHLEPTDEQRLRVMRQRWWNLLARTHLANDRPERAAWACRRALKEAGVLATPELHALLRTCERRQRQGKSSPWTADAWPHAKAC